MTFSTDCFYLFNKIRRESHACTVLCETLAKFSELVLLVRIAPQHSNDQSPFTQNSTAELVPRAFITDPTERIIQSVKLLCGNYGVMVESFIGLYIGEKGVSKTVEEVLDVFDPEFLELLALPQAERAEAAESILQPLDINSASKVV